LKFSPDGSKLVSFGQDDDNSLAIYDWENSRLICTAKVDKAAVLGCGWKSESEFTSVGQKHIKMWSLTANNCSSKRGSWGRGRAEALLDAVYVSGCCFTGGWKGSIYPWNGGSVGKAIQAHDAVYTLTNDPSNERALYSGGKDGIVKYWEAKGSSLTLLKEIINMSKISSFHPGIRNLDVFTDGSTILVGTKGSELWVVGKEEQKTNMILAGHFDGETWGCAASQNTEFYATSGDDMAIMKWDCKKKKRVAFYKHNEKVRALDYSSDSTFVVAGDWEGKVLLLAADDFKLRSEMQSTFTRGEQWIEDIKISPNNQWCAFGTHRGPSKLELMAIQDGGMKLGKGKAYNIGFTSSLLHLDWTTDSEFIVASSQAYELYWFSVNGKSTVTASATKAFEYQTFTCTLGWQVQGIWPGVDYTDVNTLCRSNGGNFMVTGDDFQKVNLLKFPSVGERSGHKPYIAHASHVTRVKFMLNDNRVVSTGGNDKTNVIWKTDFGEPTEGLEDAGEKEDEFDDIRTTRQEATIDKYGNPVNMWTPPQNNGGPIGNGTFQEELIAGGDEFMAVKPWLGAIKSPSDFAKPQRDYSKAPEINLVLDYVHGYRCKDSRGNIYYNSEGKVVTHAAAVGFTHDVASNTQTHNQNHSDDIMSIAQHPDKKLFATGEIGPKPHIYIWDSTNNNEKILEIRKGVIKGVDALGFSPNGLFLAATCMDKDHMVFIFDLAGEILCSGKSGPNEIIGLLWADDKTFVTWGKHTMKYWSFTGSSIKGGEKKAGAGYKDIWVSGELHGNDILTGTSNGELHIWSKGGGFTRGFKGKEAPHGSCLDAIVVIPGKYVLTGGKDHIIVVWNPTYKILTKIDTYKLFPDTFNGNVRAMAYNESTNKLCVGLFSAEIYECSPKNIEKGDMSVQTVLRSHYSHSTVWLNEVWGLERFNKNSDLYLTCSQDGTLREFSVSKKQMTRGCRLDIDEHGAVLSYETDPKKKGDMQDVGKLMCVGIDQNDKLAAVGCKDGTVRFVDLKGFKQIKMIKVAKEWISDIKFSPDNTKVAIGSHDDAIYILDYPELKMARGGRMKKHSSFITH
jgi:WD40 repeat protein